MNVVIRPVEKHDLEDLVILCREHAMFEGSTYLAQNKRSLLEVHLFSPTPSLLCLVVESEGALVGYTTFMKQFSTWEAAYYVYMDCLYLMQAFRSKGIGRLLLNEVIGFAKRECCSEIQWQTPESNKRAISFYQREGAEIKLKARCFLKMGDNRN